MNSKVSTLLEVRYQKICERLKADPKNRSLLNHKEQVKTSLIRNYFS